jgi:sugar phosphate isomerase/epimerase
MFQPQLGVSLHTLSTELTERELQVISSSQIATIEVMARLFDDAARKDKIVLLKEMLSQSHVRPMTVHAVFGSSYDISVLDKRAHRQALAAIDASIDLAVQLGVPMVVVHASAEPIAPAERQQRLTHAQAALEKIGQRCQKVDKRVALELLPRTCLGNTVEELFELLAPLDGDTFGVCLDTNHLMDRHSDLADTVRQLGEKLFTLHLSDYDGIDEKHELPGRGVLDWGAFMQALRDIDYSGPFNYECKIEGETVAERIQALTENYRWLSSL